MQAACRRLLLFLLLAPLLAGAKPLEMSVEALPGAHNPACLRVELTSKLERFQGWLEVYERADAPRPVLRQEIDIGSGSFAWHLYPTTGRGPIVRLRDRAGQVHAAVTVGLISGGDYLAVMPKPEQGQPTVEPPASLGTEGHVRPLGGFDTGEDDPTYTVVRDQRLLPDAWRGLASVTVIYWHAKATPELSPAQRTALHIWLRGGGGLVVEHEGLERVADLGFDDTLMERVRGVDESELPSVLKVGKGRLYVVAGSAKELPVPEGMHRSWVDDQTRLLDKGAIFKEAFGLDGEDLFWPILVLACFVLAGTVGERLLLRKLRRPHLSWLTFPLLTLGVCLVAYLLFDRSALGDIILELRTELRSEAAPLVVKTEIVYRQAGMRTRRVDLPADAWWSFRYSMYWSAGWETCLLDGRRWVELELLDDPHGIVNITYVSFPSSPSERPAIAPQLGGTESVSGTTLHLPPAAREVQIFGQYQPYITTDGGRLVPGQSDHLYNRSSIDPDRWPTQRAVMTLYHEPGKRELWHLVVEPLPEVVAP